MSDKVTTSVEVQMQSATAQGLVPLMTTSDGEIIFFKPKGANPSDMRAKIVDCYKCSDCGRQLMFSKGMSHIVCPACGSENLERTTMGEMLNKTITVNLTNEDN
ncbi:MAG: zinc ribbon domain-containing protein [Rikenellaceae bacterium]|nr:zinc ribbon domain-containing protein [Rikenellaceae bacterium]